MATYILLLTLTPEGREQALADSKSVLAAAEGSADDGVEVLGIYGVLGDYDFVAIVETKGNEEVGRFSLMLGVRAGAHIQTLPAIPFSRLSQDIAVRVATSELPLPSEDEGGDGESDAGTGSTASV